MANGYDLAVLILKEGSWGAFDKKGNVATEAEVRNFFTTAIAIATIESGLNARKINGNKKGLFQIDSVKYASVVGDADLTNPTANIRAAAAISKQAVANGKPMFSPWAVTIKRPDFAMIKAGSSGVYDDIKKLSKEDLDREAAKSATELDTETGSLLNNLNPLSGIQAVTGSVLDFTKKTGIVIGVFLLGIVLLILGLIVIARPAIQKVAEATPIGKVIK